MLKNYIKIAFRVMLRQKFFTAISIFGISFTIMIFSIAAGLTNVMIGNSAPTVNRDRTIYLGGFAVTSKNDERSYTPPGNTFFNDVEKINGVEILSKYISANLTSFINDKKVSLRIAFADENIWSAYEHKFIEGRRFTAREAAEGQSIVVITESVKKHFFNDGPAVGKYLETKPRLKVIGVIKDFINIMGTGPEAVQAFVPLLRYHPRSGKPPVFSAIIVAQQKSDIPSIQEGLHKLINDKYNPKKGSVYLNAQDIYEERQLSQFFPLLGAFLFFIMVIPALNLVGLNVNRISERSSEIGIRKAFGASSSVLAGQFITENLIVTIIGGVLGLILTLLSTDLTIDILFQDSDVIPSESTLISWKVMIYAIAASLIFGFLSGVVPAWRMSRLHAVNALKGGSA